MFDSKAVFEIGITSGERKVCRVRFPTDEEWCTNARAQKVVRRELGRGKSQYDGGNDEANAALFAKIREDDGAPFDEAEAGKVISRLARAEVLEIEREADGYRIALAVPGVRVSHLLRVPTLKQSVEHERRSVDVTFGRNMRETRARLEPSGMLYDALVISAEGYVGAVPIIHKAAAVVELLQELAALDDAEDLPET